MARSDSFEFGGLAEMIASPQVIFAVAACLIFSFTIYQPNTLLPELNDSKGKPSLVNTEAILMQADNLEPSKLAREGKVDLALTKAHELADTKPLDVLSNLCAGNVISKYGDKDQGILLLKKACALAPRSRWVRLDLADTLAQSKQWDDAIDQYKLILQVYPRWERPHLALADIYWKRENAQKTAEELGLALDCNSNNSEARKFRGIALAKANQSAKGFDEYMAGETQAQSIAGPPADIKQQIENWKTIDRAIFEYRHELDQNPDDANNKLRLARLLMFTGQLEEAKQTLLEARRIQPTNYEVHRNLAYVLQKLGESQLALTEFTTSVKLQLAAEKRAQLDK